MPGFEALVNPRFTAPFSEVATAFSVLSDAEPLALFVDGGFDEADLFSSS